LQKGLILSRGSRFDGLLLLVVWTSILIAHIALKFCDKISTRHKFLSAYLNAVTDECVPVPKKEYAQLISGHR
jgi:hypothetical protein